MAEKTPTFFPHDEPSKYAYTSDFYDVSEKAGRQAFWNTQYYASIQYGTTNFKILDNLQTLIDGARQAELSFLADTGVDITNGDNAKKIFENMNLILNSQKLFERNKQLMQQFTKNKNVELKDPSKFFFTYLKQGIEKYAIEKHFNVKKAAGPQLKQVLDQIMGYALEHTYSMYITTQKGESEQQVQAAMQEMVQAIQNLQNTGVFSQYADLFKLKDKLLEGADKKGIVVSKPKMTIGSFDKGGTPLELVTSVVTAEMAKINCINQSSDFSLQITGGETGSSAFNEQKGDSMLAFATGEIDFSQMQQIFEKHKKDDGSTRLQNINAFQEFLDKFGDKIKHLVVISDKNYTINANWRGFHAQEPMTLENAEAMLGKFDVPNIQELIDYLANCGPDMIQGDVTSQVETEIASYIGYFLFDHLEITGSPTSATNVVNVINLGNTYIPLSVYLEGVYNSLSAHLNGMTSDNLVEVTISLDGNTTAPSKWTEDIWNEFRSDREKSSTLAYKVMQDIAQYVTELINN